MQSFTASNLFRPSGSRDLFLLKTQNVMLCIRMGREAGSPSTRPPDPRVQVGCRKRTRVKIP